MMKHDSSDGIGQMARRESSDDTLEHHSIAETCSSGRRAPRHPLGTASAELSPRSTSRYRPRMLDFEMELGQGGSGCSDQPGRQTRSRTQGRRQEAPPGSGSPVRESLPWKGRTSHLDGSRIRMLHTATLIHDDTIDMPSLIARHAYGHRLWATQRRASGDYLSGCSTLMTAANRQPSAPWRLFSTGSWLTLWWSPSQSMSPDQETAAKSTSEPSAEDCFAFLCCYRVRGGAARRQNKAIRDSRLMATTSGILPDN